MIRLIFSLMLLTSLLSGQSTEKVHKARIKTVFGDLIVKLHNDTPIHRDNFIKNVKNGWYDGTLLHRVIPYFMAQGGNPISIDAPPEQALSVDQCTTLPAEIKRHYYHKKGAIAAARLPDGANPEKRSSGCQFFVVHGYKYNEAQLTGMENDNFKFSDYAKAYYKTQGGAAHLDMGYTIFAQVVEGLEVIDLICGISTGKLVPDRPNSDIIMTIEMIEE